MAVTCRKPFTSWASGSSRVPVIRLVWSATIRLCVAVVLVAPSTGHAAINWHEPWSVLANGQYLSVTGFSSDLTVDAVARELAGNNVGYQHYLVGDGRMLLTGVHSGKHWLADIQGSPLGSQGYVSALYFDPAEAAPTVTVARAFSTQREGGFFPREAGLPVQIFEFDSSVAVGLFGQSELPMTVAVSTPEP